MNDNYNLFRQHDTETEVMLKRLPKCDKCNEHIQDDYLYEIKGFIYCEECIREHFRRDIEEYIEE